MPTAESQRKFYCIIRDKWGYTREIVWNASSFAEAEQKCKEFAAIQHDEIIQSITVDYDG